MNISDRVKFGSKLRLWSAIFYLVVRRIAISLKIAKPKQTMIDEDWKLKLRERVGRIVICYYANCLSDQHQSPPALDSFFVSFLSWFTFKKITFYNYCTVVFFSIIRYHQAIVSCFPSPNRGYGIIIYLKIERNAYGIKANSGT